MLTEDQVRQFHEEGYLFLPETFSAEEVDVLKSEADSIYRQDRPEVWRRNPAHRGRRSPPIYTTRHMGCWRGIQG